MQRDANGWHRAGALAYVAWGLLHIVVGLLPVVRFLSAGPHAMLANLEGVSNVPSPPLGEPLLQATHLVGQHYFNLAAAGLLAILVAVKLNWHGDRLGYWLNLIVLGLIDLSFVVGEIIPGYMPLEIGGPGPALYLIAAVLTTVGLFAAAGPKRIEEAA